MLARRGWFSLLVLSCAISVCHAENILFLQTTPSRSHHIWNKQIFDRLHENGHNLTILSFELEQSIRDKTFLLVDNFYGKIINELTDASGNDSTDPMSPFENIVNMYGFYEMASEILMKEPVVLDLLNYPKDFKFHMIVHDFTMGQFLLGFVQRFDNPPLVSVSAFNAPSYTTFLADIPLRVTTMPNYAADFGTSMNLIQRLWNTFYWCVEYYYRQRVFMSRENRRLRQIFGENTSTIEQIERQSSIVLVNSDFSFDYHQALPPNVIPVGGLHIQRSDNLGPELQTFLSRPSKGTVVFSLGSNVKVEELGYQINQAILQTFTSFPDYNFVWKHGAPEWFNTVPENVILRKWIPQSGLLADTRTKLLIGHGGLLGLQEALWYGIPVIGIPFFADQYQNVDKLERVGVGLKLLLSDLNIAKLRQSVGSVLGDEKYRRNAHFRAKLFRTQPQPPLERAIFWLEKVLEHRDFPHLTSPTLDMSPVQIYGLDLVLGTALIFAVVYKISARLLSFANKDS
ncbi:UDP-glycosyltransferase UGT5-like [Uranotaenia lowii]|uniref:UDP-glycosyltransferase UGT5-like n=1 Tax=Uranotaenia lowii TaxID=190385 RepID=UPI00247B161B|nr:UDP-glycosyltransferase UGT5-like [Uranotaenia lowii]